VTWYTSGLPEATGVRLRLPNSHALLGFGRSWKTLLVLQLLRNRQVEPTLATKHRTLYHETKWKRPV